MTSLSVSEARAKLTKLIDEVDDRFGRIAITKSGKTKAILMSADEFDDWLETLEILSDSATMKAIREGEADIKAGRTIPLSQVKRELGL